MTMMEWASPDPEGYCCEYQRVDGRGHDSSCPNWAPPRTLKEIAAAKNRKEHMTEQEDGRCRHCDGTGCKACDASKLSARAQWGSSLSDPQILLAIIEEWDRQCTCNAINRVQKEIDRWKAVLRLGPSQ